MAMLIRTRLTDYYYNLAKLEEQLSIQTSPGLVVRHGPSLLKVSGQSPTALGYHGVGGGLVLGLSVSSRIPISIAVISSTS